MITLLLLVRATYTLYGCHSSCTSLLGDSRIQRNANREIATVANLSLAEITALWIFQSLNIFSFKPCLFSQLCKIPQFVNWCAVYCIQR